MNKTLINPWIQSSCIFVCFLLASISTAAEEITADGTTSTKVTSSDGKNFDIDEGNRAGNNLFHSFQNFSVPTGGSASFNNAVDIENIFSRVTGSKISNIDGLIRANGSANLFLINPAGIILGQNARLDIGGSFLGSTADSILFPKGKFSVLDLDNPPLLTVDVPIGLGIRDNPAPITNQSVANDLGLQVNTGQTLALIGGEITFDGGKITAPDSKIELGGLLATGTITIGDNFNFSFPEGIERADVTLTNAAEINVRVREGATGTGGSVEIVTATLSLNKGNQEFGTQIVTDTNGNGNAGNVTIDATNIVIDGSESGIRSAVQSDGIGNAGDIKITTDSISLANDAFLNNTTEGRGDAGQIEINANSVSLSGGSELRSDTEGQGNGGQIIINATDSISLDGVGSGGNSSAIFARSLGEVEGSGGNINITTDSLLVTNQAEVNVSSSSRGSGGNIEVEANSIELDRGTIEAETIFGEGGNITLSKADTLLLRNNSAITTNATELATGGNITINSNGIALIDNSNITAQAEDGRGGNIQITTQRLFQEPDSIIDASSERNIDGKITINRPDVDPTSGLVELPSVTIDAAAILAQDLCKFEDEKIAKGSSFIITGRGGLTPTSAEPLENLDNVVRWANQDDIEVSKNGLVGVRQRPESETSYPVIQQAQGWVTTSDGRVWLVANAPETIPQHSKIVHPDCRALQNMK